MQREERSLDSTIIGAWNESVKAIAAHPCISLRNPWEKLFQTASLLLFDAKPDLSGEQLTAFLLHLSDLRGRIPDSFLSI